MIEEEYRDKSEFNMAVSYLNRLNQLAYVTTMAAMEFDAQTWFHGIIQTYKELSPEMKDKEINDCEDTIRKLSPKVNNCIERTKRTGMSEIPFDLYMELVHFENYLKKIMRDAGLLTKLKDDPRFALSG